MLCLFHAICLCNDEKLHIACYCKNKAYFQKKGVNKRNVLHELYHHIVESKGIEMSLTKEETEANAFARNVLRKARAT